MEISGNLIVQWAKNAGLLARTSDGFPRDPAGPQLAAATSKANALHSCVYRSEWGRAYGQMGFGLAQSGVVMGNGVDDRVSFRVKQSNSGPLSVGTNSAGGAMVLLNANVSTSDVC